MPLTVRLDPKAERALDALAKRRKMSRSDVVREALVEYGAGDASGPEGPSPYDAWFDVIGIVELGARETGRTTGEQLTDIVRDQARARRPR